jgi:prepilin-type N-terminal cleavage/methylation domain-containing protein
MIGKVNAKIIRRSDRDCRRHGLESRLDCRRQGRGFTLPELLLSVLILGLLAVLAMGSGNSYLARVQLEAATRRLIVGLEQGRDGARRQGAPCALQLTAAGWGAPSSGSTAACPVPNLPLTEGLGWPGEAQLQLGHTFSGPVIFTANGLVNSGGTAVLAMAGTDLVRCVVVSAVMGVMRAGRYNDAFTQAPSASSCLPDAKL